MSTSRAGSLALSFRTSEPFFSVACELQESSAVHTFAERQLPADACEGGGVQGADVGARMVGVSKGGVPGHAERGVEEVTHD